MQPHHRAHAGGGHGIGGLGIRKNIAWNSSRKSVEIASGKWKYLNYDGFHDSCRPINRGVRNAIALWKNVLDFCLVSGHRLPTSRQTPLLRLAGVRITTN